LMLLFTTSLEAQTPNAGKDSLCYSSEEARVLADLLISGRDCILDLNEVSESYKDAKKELQKQSVVITNQELIISSKESENSLLRKKVKNRNTWLCIIGGITLILSTQLQ
jgi:hypothetical protein